MRLAGCCRARSRVLLPNPGERFALACGDDPGTLGLRVPAVPALAGVAGRCCSRAPTAPAAPTRGAWTRCPSRIRARRRPGDRRRRAARDAVDGGRPARLRGRRRVVGGARGGGREDAIAALLRWQFHFDPSSYAEMITPDMPGYDAAPAMQLAEALAAPARRSVLELGTGTGETARRLLGAPSGRVRWSGSTRARRCSTVARDALPDGRVSTCASAPIEERSPRGAVRPGGERAVRAPPRRAPRRPTCSAACTGRWRPGGRFVLADVVVPEDPADGDDRR